MQMSALDELTQKLEDTYKDIAQTKTEVVEALRSFYTSSSAISIDEAMALASKWSNPTCSADLNDGKTQESEIQCTLKQLGMTLHDVIKRLRVEECENDDGSAASLNVQLIRSNIERKRVKKQITQSKEMLRLVDEIIVLDSSLQEIDVHLDRLDISKASISLVETFKRLESLKNMEDNGKSESNVPGGRANFSIIRVMETQWRKRKCRAEATLKKAFESMLEFGEKGLDIMLTYSDLEDDGARECSTQINWSSLWFALQSMDLHRQCIEEVALKFMDQVVKPYLHSSHPSKLDIQLQPSRLSIKIAKLGGELVETTASDKTTCPEAAVVGRKLLQIVNSQVSIYSSVFCDNHIIGKEWIEAVWACPGNLELLMESKLTELIPQDPISLPSLKSQLDEIIGEIMQKVKELKVETKYPADLLRFTTELDSKHIEKRRHAILSAGREAISRTYCDSIKISGATERCNISASGDSGKHGSKAAKSAKDTAKCGSSMPLSNDKADDDTEYKNHKMPDYRISTCAHDIVELAHQTMFEATKCGVQSVEVLLTTVRDLFFLFRMVISTIHADDISNDGRICMLFHNDCMYIAYHMLTMGYHNKDRLPSSLSSRITFIDIIPEFRNAAADSLTQYSKKLRDELLMALVSLPTLLDQGEHKSQNAYQECVQTVLYKVNRLSSTWKEGLPNGVYQRAMGMILEPYVASFANHLLDHSEAIRCAKSQLIHTLQLLSQLSSAFESNSQAEKYAPSLMRLANLEMLMREPLASISANLQAGRIKTLEKKHIVKLVKTLFDDGTERREFLAMMAQT